MTKDEYELLMSWFSEPGWKTFLALLEKMEKEYLAATLSSKDMVAVYESRSAYLLLQRLRGLPQKVKTLMGEKS